MNHWLIAPILLPLATALLLLALLHRSAGRQRALSLASAFAGVGIAAWLLAHADSGAIEVYRVGAWPAPFGIVLVLDRLSALMLLLGALLGLASLLYACAGADRSGPGFHPLFHLQLMGLNGAFLTGDLFNLFVFFEVLLIASYGLLLHGGGAARSRAGFHYVVLNLVGSSLFLIAAGLLYGSAGTLNMADLGAWLARGDGAELPTVRVAAALLLVVFGLKAALAPLYFWLPSAYSAAAAPVAALFCIMTKVGVYAILRLLTLGAQAGVPALTPWLLGVGLATLVLAHLGVLSTRRLRALIAYLLVGSIGTALVALAPGSAAGFSAALYYLVHSTLLGAALFLLADLTAAQRGPLDDRLHAGPALTQPTLLGAAYFLGAAAYAGLPPFSGFIGKLLVLRASWEAPAAGWVWTSVLATGLVALVALVRAGSTLYWKSLQPGPMAPAGGTLRVAAMLALLAASPLLALAAAPLLSYTDATARQLVQPQAYWERVLGASAGAWGTVP